MTLMVCLLTRATRKSLQQKDAPHPDFAFQHHQGSSAQIAVVQA